MGPVSNISTAWMNAEREISHGLSAQQAFLQFLQDQQKSEWFRDRLAQLRSEYELIRRLVSQISAVEAHSQETLVLVDFDVIRAYITDESTRRSDYLHIRYFFENSKMAYVIPHGARIELRKYFQAQLGLRQFPVNSEPHRFSDRLHDYLFHELNEPNSIINEARLENVRIIANRLIRILSDPRHQSSPLDFPSSHHIAAALDRVLFEIRRSPRHAHLSLESKQEIAHSDALNLASLFGAASTHTLLLTASRYVILASRGIAGLNPRVVKPRTLSLFSELAVADGGDAALARATDIILAIGSIDQRILKFALDISFKKGSINDRSQKKLEGDARQIWYALREAIPDYMRILNVEGKRAPLLSYEWVREELAMTSAKAKLKGATVSYLRMLSVIQKCMNDTDGTTQKEYIAEQKLTGTCNNVWLIRESGVQTNGVADENPAMSGPPICRLSLLVEEDTNRNKMVIDWPIDTAFFPLVACVEDEYLSQLRRCGLQMSSSEPYCSTQQQSGEYGVHVILDDSVVTFPASWIAGMSSLDFMYPWNLRKFVSKILGGSCSFKNEHRAASKMQCISVSIPEELLEYDLSPSAGFARRAILSFGATDWRSRLEKIWPWLGPRTLNITAVAQRIDEIVQSPVNKVEEHK